MKIDKPTITDYTNATHNHSDNANGGTLTASSISDFDTEVSNNTTVASAVQPAEIRELLTANRNYYVSTTGSDSNDGLTSGTPFLTFAKFISTYQMLDFAGYSVYLYLANGTYNEGFSFINPPSGRIFIVGDTTTPTNVQITNSGGSGVFTRALFPLSIEGLYLTGGSYGVTAQNQAGIAISSCQFGTNTFAHVRLTSGATATVSSCSVSGGALRMFQLEFSSGLTLPGGSTITLTGTPAFTQFALATSTSQIISYGTTFSGSATGTRYSITGNAMADVGGSATYFPGSVAGSTANGGQYF